MATHKQITVEAVDNPTSIGSKSTKSHLMALYPNSPIHSGELTAEERIKAANELLLAEIVNDGGHTFGEIARNYGEAPDMASVETGAGGLPASPYVPNPASPTDGVSSPESIPAAPAGYGTKTPTTWGMGEGSKLSPHNSSAQISGQTVGDLPMGRSSR